MRRIRRGALALVVCVVAGGLGSAPPAGAAVGTLNLTSICSYNVGPYAGQHLWRVTSTFAADEAYTSQSPWNSTGVSRTATPNRSWFLGVADTTKISYTNDSGPQQVTKAANTNTCSGLAFATITTPPEGASYVVGDAVPADFACSGEELVSCVGTVADGTPIDTGSLGAKSFVVTATAWDGSTVDATSNYTVVAPPGPGTPALNGCKNTTLAGAEMGLYPAQTASQSSLRVSCTFNNQPGTSQVAASWHIDDFPTVGYHNGAARTITNTATIPSGSTTFTAANCSQITGWVNHPIATDGSFVGIPPRTFVKSISGACLVTLSQATTATITGAGRSFKIDNAIARSVANSGVSPTLITFASGGTVLTSTAANFTAADIGLSVSGTEIAPLTTITGVAGNTATISNATTAAHSTGTAITFGGDLQVTSTRQVNDAKNSSTTVINSPAAKWKPDDVGLPVYGPGIPANTFIVSVSGANATTTGGLAINAGPNNVVIGDPTATAPKDGDTVSTIAVQLDVNPGLVAGSEDCSAENAEGFYTVGRWLNPGSFTGSAPFNTQPAGTKAIGQIYMDTSVADFSIFVIETNNPFGPGAFTYSLWTPNTPTTLAMCPGTATSPGLGFSLGIQGQTQTVADLPAGTGRPGTAQLRAVLPDSKIAPNDGSWIGSVTITSDDVGVTFAPASEFTRLCVYPAGPAAVSFKCGNG